MSVSTQEPVEVDLGGHVVTVPRGGLYDRYRMATDLDEVARDPRVSGVEFFRQLPKTRVDSPIGPTLTPNFYYRMSSARLSMLAPARAVRSRLPEGLDPLEVLPGIGLVAVMFFRYDVCDIDFYTEATVAVVVRPARHGRLGFADTLAGLDDDDLHAYVLSLPVNTKIAQVRGHDGYGFPKWVTDIDVDIDDRRTTGRVANDSGGTDIALSVATPAQRSYPTCTKVGTLHSYTLTDRVWRSTLSQTNVLTGGSAVLPKVDLQLGTGRMSDDVRSLRPIRTVRLDVLTDAQNALHMPVPVSVPARS